MERTTDLRSLKALFWRRKGWFLVPFLLLLCLSTLYAIGLPDVYRSTATITIQNQQIPPDIVPSAVHSYADQRIQAITQEVKSRAKILRLAETFDLLPESRKRLITEELVQRIRDRISIEPINAEINRPTERRPVLLTIAFTVSYEDEDPAKARAVTHEIASYYTQKNLQSREEGARGTTAFLQDRMEQVRAEMNGLEDLLARYRQEHLEALPEFTKLNMQKLEKIDSDVRNVNIQIRTLEEQRATLRNRLSMIDPYSGASDRVLSPEERLQQVQLERAELISRYSPKHPLIKAKDREIALLEKRVGDLGRLNEMQDGLEKLEQREAELRARYTEKHPSVRRVAAEKQELEKAIEALRREAGQTLPDGFERPRNPAYVALMSDLDKIEVSLEALQGEKQRLEGMSREVYGTLHATPEVARKYHEMENDYEAAKAHYQEIQQKYLAAQVSQGMEEEQLGETFRIEEPAFLPERPFKPNRKLILLLGVALSLCVSVLLVTVREYTDSTIRDGKQLEALTGSRSSP